MSQGVVTTNGKSRNHPQRHRLGEEVHHIGRRAGEDDAEEVEDHGACRWCGVNGRGDVVLKSIDI